MKKNSECTSSRAAPQRLRVRDELGRQRALDTGPTAFSLLYTGAEDLSVPVVLLGLGPDPQAAADILEGALPTAEVVSARQVFWVECPEFSAQMPDRWHTAIPPAWKRLSPEELLLLSRRQAFRFFRYTQAARLFSTFWGPLLAAIQTARLAGGSVQRPSTTIVIPGSEGDLLTHELEAAVRAEGYTPIRPSGSAPDVAAQITQDERPALYLSVNLRGLDAEGETFRLLQARGVPVAVWFVDNPWHQLSALRLPWWREADLFVTDASFIEPLRRHGAASVHHLPLGAWMPEGGEAAPEALSPIVFVGRSAFPHRERFFSGCRVPPQLQAEAEKRLTDPGIDASALPHVQWWEERLGGRESWPGNTIRQAGLGAERCSTLRRRLWLESAHGIGLTVFGDDAWRDALPPGTDVRPPVDYYHGLADIYRHAPYSLNITSLLLPQGLTQRHFDVWTAGGFLLTDATPGLDIFPRELTRPIALSHPCRLAGRLEELEKDPRLRAHLSQAWRSCLREQHGYPARLRTLFEKTKAGAAASFQASPHPGIYINNQY